MYDILYEIKYIVYFYDIRYCKKRKRITVAVGTDILIYLKFN